MLSDKVKNYMEIAKEGSNSLTVYGALQSFLPEIEAQELLIKEMLKLYQEILNSGSFFISAIELDTDKDGELIERKINDIILKAKEIIK